MITWEAVLTGCVPRSPLKGTGALRLRSHQSKWHLWRSLDHNDWMIGMVYWCLLVNILVEWFIMVYWSSWSIWNRWMTIPWYRRSLVVIIFWSWLAELRRCTTSFKSKGQHRGYSESQIKSICSFHTGTTALEKRQTTLANVSSNLPNCTCCRHGIHRSLHHHILWVRHLGQKHQHQHQLGRSIVINALAAGSAAG